MAGNVHGRVEALFGGVDDAAVQVVGVAEGHRVNGEIDLAEGLAAFCDDVFQAARLGNVKLQEQLGAKSVGKRLGVAGSFVILIGDGNFAPQGDDGLRNRIGDGFVVGDTSDETFFTGQRQSGG